MGRWLRSVAQFSLFLALTGLLLPAEETGWPRISLEEARRLVYMLVKEHNRDAEVSRIKDPYDADFYYFEVIVSNPVASPVIGHYAVNPWTADVWNPASCELVTLPSITRLQEKLREKLRLTEKDYMKLRTKKPLCFGN